MVLGWEPFQQSPNSLIQDVFFSKCIHKKELVLQMSEQVDFKDQKSMGKQNICIHPEHWSKYT